MTMVSMRSKSAILILVALLAAFSEAQNTPLPPCPYGDRLGFYACFSLRQANLCTNTFVVSQCEATCGKFVNETNNQLENCCSDSNLGEEICTFLDSVTSNYGCTIMGGNTACAATCQSCNSTANLVINGRADQFNVQKGIEDLFHDKETFAQYAEMLKKLGAY